MNHLVSTLGRVVAIALISVCSSSLWAEDAVKHEVKVLGPNVISTSAQEFGATATPSGDTLYYTYSDSGYTHMTVMTSNKRNGVWAEPKVVSFSGVWNDADPSLSPDGKRLYFISNRPVDGKMTGFLEVWYTERDGDNWGEPKPVRALLVDKGFKTYPSVASDGTLYFASGSQVYLSRLVEGVHKARETVDVQSSAVSIAPDQSFMILHHKAPDQKRSSLAISYSHAGAWTEPSLLPKPINSAANESSPNIAGDGKTLYFTSSRMDWSTFSWPRKQRVNSLADVKMELQGTWQNGLRNIYQVVLNRDVLDLPAS